MNNVNHAEVLAPPVYHGWINLYKPEGITSARAVAMVKRLLGVKKVGHAGTLDPMACGVLPLAINEATKTVSYAMFSTKSYRFTVCFGEETSTADREGEVTATSDVRPTRAQIEAVLPMFVGEILQTPPIFSAIKVDGKRAYKLAREGKDVQLTPRKVQIDALILEGCDAGSATFYVTCGKGTYVRSLAVDIATELGTKGHVTFLERTVVGKFDKECAILLENQEKTAYNAKALIKSIMPTHIVLDDIPVLYGDNDILTRVRHGMTVFIDGVDHEVVALMDKEAETLVALGRYQAGKFKPSRVFNI
jgi:tRNA pseudouridine55 synthase